MRYPQTFQQRRHYLIKCAAIIAAICLFGLASRAQDARAGQQSESPWSKDLNKYPGLLAEIGQLLEKLQQNIQFPAARTESHLLPLLPQSTISFAAFPNYGNVAQQTLKIFRQELQESAVLRDWWVHGELAAPGHKVEDSLEKFDQLHQYLGDEIVVTGTMEGRSPSLLVVAEVRKPGLKKFLQQTIEQLAGKAKPRVRMLDPEDLAIAMAPGPSQELLVLVRPDFVVAALDLATLRSFSARLDGRSREFASTPFGQRATQEYEGGLTILVAANLHEILNQLPPGAKQDPTFQRTGFGDVNYLIWEHKSAADKTVSQMELSFIAPRHGAASWLAKSGPLGSLDFVSPKAFLASTVLLKDPAQIFEDVKELASLTKPNTFAALPQFEQTLGLSLREDLLSLLGGELTVELDNLVPQPVWKAMLAVKDGNRLQQTLNTLLAAAHLEAGQKENEGITYHTVRIPSPATATEIGFAFVDGYLVMGSSHDVVADAVRLHRSGGSLAKSKKLTASLPPGRSLEASALLFMDPIAMRALQLRQLSPEIAESLTQNSAEVAPAVVGVYADEMTIREASTSPGFDAGAALVVAAIAIPNLLRSRIAANEASAVGSVRSVNTAQVVYATTYPKRGFAPNLATLGPVPGGTGAASQDHADLLDGVLANESCTGEALCTKSGYLFRIASVCTQNRCDEYVVVAMPVTPGTTGIRSFCSTSDGVIHTNSGTPVPSSLSAAECKAWPPI